MLSSMQASPEARAYAPARAVNLSRGRATRLRAVASTDDAVLASYRRLQNGSDVRGVALVGIAGQDVTLTAKSVAFLGVAFAHWLAAKESKPAGQLRVSVGSDPRLSGPSLTEAFCAGVARAGASPIPLGLSTTPACFTSCITAGYEYDGSVMLTASHLPWNRNGIKFFTRGGGLSKKDISALCEAAAHAEAAAGGRPPALARPLPPPVDFLSVYASQLVELIRKGADAGDKPLAGMRILVDAGNGSGGFFADRVLAPLGADTSGSQFLDPDGHFPNHIPNPEDAGAVASASAAVKAAGADLGVIFDTDVDRSAIIERSGAAINRNRLIALLSAIVLRERPGATIVTDSVTSDGLSAFIEQLGGAHFRYRRGYKNVIDKGVELAAAGVDAPLMIETSGHGAMAENHYLDDGAYLAVKVLVEAARRRAAGQGGVEALLASLREPLEEAEFRIPIRAADFKAAGGEALAAFHAALQAGAAFPDWSLAPGPSHEGWRAVVPEGEGRAGWALLRASLHDPLLVLNVESERRGGAAAAVSRVRCWLAQSGVELDTSAMDAAFEAGGVYEGLDVECAADWGVGEGKAEGGPRLGGGTCGDTGECTIAW